MNLNRKILSVLSLLGLLTLGALGGPWGCGSEGGSNPDHDHNPPLCGNGTKETGEACDDGNTVDEDLCKNDCTTPPPSPNSFCGDGQVGSDEACDDGNQNNGDGCSSQCVVEAATLEPVNGCDPATAKDETAVSNHQISTVNFTYSPSCLKVKAGSTVTFNSNFSAHPLVGGVIDASFNEVPDTSSPIKNTTTGTTVQFTFSDAGSYGYYCDFHGTGGMKGAVYVVE